MASIIGTTGDDIITPGGVSAGVTGGVPSAADDTINGISGRDLLDGGGGNDLLTLGDYNTGTLLGGDGNDTLEGGANWSATLSGGAGDDVLSAALSGGAADYAAAAAGINVELGAGIALNDGDGGSDTLINIWTVFGSASDDRIAGATWYESLVGNDGNDTLIGGNGDDTLAGGAGDDVLRGGGGGYQGNFASYRAAVSGIDVNLGSGVAADDGYGDHDILIGISNVIGSDFADRITGDAGNNSIDGWDGADTLIGGAGDDWIVDTGGRRNVLLGGTGNDVLIAYEGGSRINGGDGDDFLQGSAAGILPDHDTVIGGGGDDHLIGGYNSLLDGGSGDDILSYSPGSTLYGGEGNDTAEFSLYDPLTINLGAGTVISAADSGIFTGIENARGGTEGDRITGDLGANRLDGVAGNDTLLGRDGDDTLGEDNFDRGAGDDVLRGGAGNDTLIGGLDEDTLIGGAGSDHFVYGGVWLARNGGDVIVDFQNGSDVIEINNYGAALDSFADLDIRQVGSNAQIHLSTSVPLAGVIILTGFNASLLDQTDFIFG